VSFYYLLARCACLTNESPDWSSSDSFILPFVSIVKAAELNPDGYQCRLAFRF